MSFSARLSRRGILPLVFVIVGCFGSEPVQPSNAHIGQPSSLRLPVRSIHDEFRRLARSAPGFTGVFFDDQGELVISVASDSFTPSSKAFVLGWARSFSAAAANKTSAAIRRVKYDYNSLSDGLERAFAIMHSEDNLTSISIDESRGVLVLGVASLSVERSLRGRLEIAGLPRDMIEVQQVDDAETRATLNDYYRPTMGGLQVRGHNSTPCTLGLNVMKWETGLDPVASPKYFLTAGHCAETMGQDNDLPWYQPHDHRIGQEHQAVPLSSGAACPG